MNYFMKRQDTEYERCDGILHEIKQNDTLYKLARFYKVSLMDLMDKNPMVDVYNLKIGDKLCIPIKQNTYIVKKGDSLEWILEHFQMNYETFRDMNPHFSPIMLKENEMIYIPNINK